LTLRMKLAKRFHFVEISQQTSVDSTHYRKTERKSWETGASLSGQNSPFPPLPYPPAPQPMSVDAQSLLKKEFFSHLPPSSLQARARVSSSFQEGGALHRGGSPRGPALVSGWSRTATCSSHLLFFLSFITSTAPLPFQYYYSRGKIQTRKERAREGLSRVSFLTS